MSRKGNPDCSVIVHSFAMYMLRHIFWHAQDGQCGICRRPMIKKFGSPTLSLDHVWPKCWSAVPGGKLGTFLGNLLLTHQSCNRDKDDKRPTDEQVAFLEQVNRRLGFRPDETAFWDRK